MTNTEIEDLKKLAESAHQGKFFRIEFIYAANPQAILDLIAELEKYKREFDVQFQDLCDHKALLLNAEGAEERLRSELEKCKKDAERYQWLKKSSWYVGPGEFYCTEGGQLVEIDDRNTLTSSLDESIDADMKEQ